MSRLGVAERPICPACGLWSPPLQLRRLRGICKECWIERDSRVDSPYLMRIITPPGTVHWDARCPAVTQAQTWTLSNVSDATGAKCSRCKWYPLFKIDHFTDRDVRGIEQGVSG